MSQPTVLELCAGYNGLGMAVEEVFGARTIAFSEYDAAPSKILAHHYPDVPNYGDMTKIDWAAIEQADIISGGTPCQDLSAAGKRKGMSEGTRSNLWVQMREAIAIQRPKYVVWENVRGAYSATAASDVEFCAGCMGSEPDCNLRALGRVLGDLSDLGFNAEWRGLRAADVGAPHARFRVFVLAHDSRSVRGGKAEQHDGRSASAHDRAGLLDQSDSHAMRPRPLGEATTDPRSEAGEFRTGLREGGARVGRERPTNYSGLAFPADPQGLGWGEGRPESEGLEGRLDAPLSGRAVTPDAGSDGRVRRQDNEGEGWLPRVGGEEVNHPIDGSTPRFETNWGEYESAIRRWERTIGRSAPRPTERTGRNDGQRLSQRFTEWMMGLPDGWVTDPAIGITRNEQLKACGNGVVPQQAMAALRDMLAAFDQQEAS